MKITERKLRRIIQSVIHEAMGNPRSIDDIEPGEYASADSLRSGMPSSGLEFTDHANQMTRDHGVSINDGFLDRDEWSCLFDLVDMNGDGVITKDEWNAAFGQLDLDNDQKISVDEIESSCKDSSNY